MRTDLCSCPSPAVERRTKTSLQSKCRWAIRRWCSCWCSKLQKYTRKRAMNTTSYSQDTEQTVCSFKRLSVTTLANTGQKKWEALKDAAFLTCYECQDCDIYWTMRSFLILTAFANICNWKEPLLLAHMALYSAEERKSIGLLYSWAALTYLMSIRYDKDSLGESTMQLLLWVTWVGFIRPHYLISLLGTFVALCSSVVDDIPHVLLMFI